MLAYSGFYRDVLELLRLEKSIKIEINGHDTHKCSIINVGSLHLILLYMERFHIFQFVVIVEISGCEPYI